ncbi:carboxypeptidase regulatory-like domain-containing protein [Caldichromatium japonicum]|uniref:Carboxypeptidase regulatory-like domain-containing protein n=1 Tax=Caldichromatium japonicum TaxID=2699430 RepID=A0A6G7VC98_9GAMM|nr:carboxypeptidase-like regulatory domain-containing protein [Caldichromatium japonicum]QIK37641.1 carboxypeptidase regulatory-like domain-containing protein [Caldichromatium japonicum]
MRKFWVLACLLLLISAPALAHRIKVFAQIEGDWIKGRVYFVGGALASGARIELRDAEGRLLAELAPDAEGRFGYRIETAGTYQVIATTADGHRAEQSLNAAPLRTFSSPLAEGDSGQTSTAPPTSEMSGLPLPSPAPSIRLTGLDPGLIALIDQTLARQTQPLAEQLNALDERIRLQDLLGGIGYILGLTGLALWWRCRRP